MNTVEYNVNLVFCVDATSDAHGMVATFRLGLATLHADLSQRFEQQRKLLNGLRIKIIVFRDFYSDCHDALEESPFFALPTEQRNFCAFVDGIATRDGDHELKCGLEALALAIRSDWGTTEFRKRNVIVMLTDAPAHPLQMSKSQKPLNYPVGIPEDFDGLTDIWEMTAPMLGRLIMFCPDKLPWRDIATYWENAILYPGAAGNSLYHGAFNAILDAITYSI